MMHSTFSKMQLIRNIKIKFNKSDFLVFKATNKKLHNNNKQSNVVFYFVVSRFLCSFNVLKLRFLKAVFILL